MRSVQQQHRQQPMTWQGQVKVQRCTSSTGHPLLLRLLVIIDINSNPNLTVLLPPLPPNTNTHTTACVHSRPHNPSCSPATHILRRPPRRLHIIGVCPRRPIRHLCHQAAVGAQRHPQQLLTRRHQRRAQHAAGCCSCYQRHSILLHPCSGWGGSSPQGFRAAPWAAPQRRCCYSSGPRTRCLQHGCITP